MKNKNFRSDKARMQRSLDDMARTRETFVKDLKAAKERFKKVKDREQIKVMLEAIDQLTDVIHVIDITIITLKAKYKCLGIDLSKPNPATLTPKEEVEVTALRYRSLQGKPLYTLKELARQYGTTIDVIKQIDYNAPM